MMTGFSLNKITDSFTFPYKVYPIGLEFVDHVIKTYENTNSNLGILLNGLKGSGKTVTAKILANKLNLPVIIIKGMENNSSLFNFLSEIGNDCVFFFDEFEKEFGEDNSILSFMDGVYNTNYRKVFLLTTNTLNVDQNLIGRPSRIRYLKSFKNLPSNIASSYLDDNLKDKSKKQVVMDFIHRLRISTIDIVKCLVEEINIHGEEGFRIAQSYFNIEFAKYRYFGDVVCLPNNDNSKPNFELAKAILEKNKEINSALYAEGTTIKERNQLLDELKKLKHKYQASVNSAMSFTFDKRWDTYSIGEQLYKLYYGDDEDDSDGANANIVMAIDTQDAIIAKHDIGNSFIEYVFISNPNVEPLTDLGLY